MKILITGLRGVGKSELRTALAANTGFSSRSVGDFMEEFCQKNYPGIGREEMRERLTVVHQLRIFAELVPEIKKYPDLILESQSVIFDDFGIMIPVQPIFRMVGLDAIILLEADPSLIKTRRLNDSKERLPRFLEESISEIQEQQIATQHYIVSFCVTLAIHGFIIQNNSDRSVALGAMLRALEVVRFAKAFHSALDASSEK